jgi:hypothetical protein
MGGLRRRWARGWICSNGSKIVKPKGSGEEKGRREFMLMLSMFRFCYFGI